MNERFLFFMSNQNKYRLSRADLGSSSYVNDEVIFRSSKIKKQGKRLFKRSLQVLSDNIFWFLFVIQRLTHVTFLKTTNETIFPCGILLEKKFSVFINTLFWNMSFEVIFSTVSLTHFEFITACIVFFGKTTKLYHFTNFYVKSNLFYYKYKNKNASGINCQATFPAKQLSLRWCRISL